MQRKKNGPDYATLEPRKLLAGDVTAIVAGNTLVISGDNASNEVLVSVNDSGNIEVAGRNETTINGNNQVFEVDLDDSMINDLRLFLAGGDDFAFVEDIEIENRLTIRGGAGSDTIGIFQVNVANDLYLDSGAGNDSVSVDRASIGDNLVIRTGGGEDFVGIDESDIRGRTVVDTGARHDRIAIRDSIHQSRVRISSGGGSDFISADGLTVNDAARINSGGRSDNIFVNDSSFGSRLFARGAGGTDNLEVTGDSEFSTNPRLSSFEGTEVIGGIPQSDQLFGDLVESGARLGSIVELAAMTPDLSALVGALQATGLDSALAGDGPFTVFAPLNSAFDAIAGVVAGLSTDQVADVLRFHVIAGEVFAEELVTLNSVETLLGQSFTVDTTNGVVLNGNATLAMTDIRARNGVVHLLNDVLVPVL